MKFHHAAALACFSTLLGWFLMVPPRGACTCPGGPMSFGACACAPNTNAPLKEWIRDFYFDSLDACQDRLKTMTGQIDDGDQCVGEGDPRLAK
jgi:hypothetical protein